MNKSDQIVALRTALAVFNMRKWLKDCEFVVQLSCANDTEADLFRVQATRFAAEALLLNVDEVMEQNSIGDEDAIKAAIRDRLQTLQEGYGESG